MKFREVPEIPNGLSNRKKKDVRSMLDEFIRSNIMYALIELDDSDYCRKESARQSISQVVTKFNYPIKVKTRRGTIYLERTER